MLPENDMLSNMKLTILALLAATPITAIWADNATDSISINEVVITGTRTQTDVRQLSQTVTVIDRSEIEESNRTSLLPLLTEQVPGLFVTQRGYAGYGVSGGAAGNISMRGMSGSAARMVVLIDGHPNYAGIFGHPIADSYQSLMTEQVEVLRGPASMLYGSGAMAGVINIVTRKQAQGTHAHVNAGYGSYNTAQTELSVSNRKDKFSVVAGGSYNRTDGHRDNMDFEQYAGFAKLGYDISKHWNASANVDVTSFTASQPGSTQSPLIDADQKITRGTTTLFVENRYDRTQGGISLFYSWGDHWINDGYTPGASAKEYRFISHDEMSGASAWQSLSLIKGNRLTVGFDYYRYGGKARNHFVEGTQKGTDVPQVDKYENELAGYLEMRQSLGTWLTLNAGLRADHHSTVGTEFVPQAGAAFHLPANAEVKLSAGKGFRYPIIREMYMYNPKNPELKPESLWNYELAFSQNLMDGRLMYGINLFHMDVENTILTLPSASGPLNQNSGELKNSGVEIETAIAVTGSVRVNANYSWLHMETPVIAAPVHKAYLGGSYTKGAIHASTGLQYIKGLYTTPKTVQPATVIANPDVKESFLLWNARFSYQLTDMIQLWVNADNLLNREYQINAGYPMPGISFMGGVNLSF